MGGEDCEGAARGRTGGVWDWTWRGARGGQDFLQTMEEWEVSLGHGEQCV